ncbi:MAG: hypothetical protein ACP5ML_04095, partial [Fervidicoccus sp.]
QRFTSLRIPRTPGFYINMFKEYSNLLGIALGKENGLIDFMSFNYSLIESLIWIRSFQWLGILDSSFVSNPYRYGVKSVKIKYLPIAKYLRELPQEEAGCYSLLFSYILPTPFRSAILISQSSKSLEEVAKNLLEKGKAVERMLAIEFLQSQSEDLVFLMKMAFASGFVRRGKKSDKGGYFTYLREQSRKQWKEHPCYTYFPLNSIFIELVEKEIYGDVEAFLKNEKSRLGINEYLSERKEIKSRERLIDVLFKIKEDFASIYEYYTNYYDIRINE